jgi:CcmD family protein
LTVESRKGEFVPVSGGHETTSAESLLVAAYVLMWCAVFVFVWRTAAKQRSLEGRLGELEKALDSRENQT